MTTNICPICSIEHPDLTEAKHAHLMRMPERNAAAHAVAAMREDIASLTATLWALVDQLDARPATPRPRRATVCRR